MNYLDLASVAKGIQSTSSTKALDSFFANGGVIGYNVSGQGTRYVSNDVPGKAGTILIDPLAQNLVAGKVGGEVQAARDLITHELGHFVYELQDKATFTAAQGSVEARVDYCFMREAEASMFAFAVASELKTKELKQRC
jgi:hypothetical protein